MAEIKKYGSGDRDQDLKKKDSQKGRENTSSARYVPPLDKNKVPDSMVNVEVTSVNVKKRLPVAVDIISGVLMLLIVVGVVIGSYALFRYYANDYDSKELTYELIVPCDDIEQMRKLVDKDIYLDTADNSIFFGRITKVKHVEGETERARVCISATVNYRSGEGYSLGGKRIAVGSEFTQLRCGERYFGNASVIDLDVDGGK